MRSRQYRVPPGDASWSAVPDRPDPDVQLVLALGPSPRAEAAPDAAWHAQVARR